MKLTIYRRRSILITFQSRLPYQAIIRIFGFTSFVWLSACASIEPASEAGDPIIDSYTSPVDSGLRARHPFPNPDDVCVSLYSNSLTKPFEIENHFLIACPKHEIGAIEDRKVNQKAQVVGNAKHWVVMRILITSTT